MSKLVIKNSDFRNKLQSIIDNGEEIFGNEIRYQNDFDSINEDFTKWHEYNLEYLKHAFGSVQNEYRTEYAESGLSFMGDIISVHEGNPYLVIKDYIKAKLDNLKRLLHKAELIASNISEEKSVELPNLKTNLSKTEVFIVHGHDDGAKIKAARFVEKLGFKPIILHEQRSLGKTIIEKIESYTNVGFGIVLYTPCDLGGKKESDTRLQNRARQNVVFEHGPLIGKIGRENVCALVKDDVEKLNDIAGVVFIKMDEDEAWHLKLAKELNSSGYEVDMNKL